VGVSGITAMATGEGIGGALDSTFFASPMVDGIWTLYHPVITSVRFGTINHRSDDMTKIDLRVSYNNFKYEQALV